MLPPTTIPILESVASCRTWRLKAFDEKKSVGFVPTMGAFHEGHLSLVRRSLSENDLTVVSIFVNPGQFAPGEDFEKYPRMLSRDLEQLAGGQVSVGGVFRTTSAVFLPSVQEMHPSGITRDVASQKGTFVEVEGCSHQMEGAIRPTLYRAIATIVTKLFNVVQPTNVYLGQKDIQQALMIRQLCRDLLLADPDAKRVHIVRTVRDPIDGVALSSRNAYLSVDERSCAGTLYRALQAAETAWTRGGTKEKSISAAAAVVEQGKIEAASKGVEMKLEYVEMNDADSFEVLDGKLHKGSRSLGGTNPILLTGMLWVGKTRLVDNIVIGDSGTIVS